MDILAIIPARGGSKGIPHKNLALCGGRPLVDWTVEAANNSMRITHAVLSSDDPEILARAEASVLAWKRPADLAADETSTEAVIANVLRSVPMPELVVLLQPTSPLRSARHIDEAIALLEDSGADSVVSVVRSHAYLWGRTAWGAAEPLYKVRQRRQEMQQFEENGAIYVCTMAHWLAAANRLGGHVELYVMDDEHRLQIDSPQDLEDMARLLKRAEVRA